MDNFVITPVTIPERLKMEWVMIAGIRESVDILKWPAITPRIRAPANIKNLVSEISE